MVGSRSKSLILRCAVLFLAFFMTAGCSAEKGQNPQGTGETQSQSTVAAPGKTAITFSYHGGEMGEVLENSVLEFNKEEKAPVSVRILKIPSDRYDETLNMLFTSGQGPDVFELESDWIDSYITKEWLFNLKKYCDKEFLDRFPSWVAGYADSLHTESGLFTLPSSLTTVRLVYNRDLFKAAGLDPDLPPLTLEELESDARTISNNEKGNMKYGFAINAGDGRDCFKQFLESVYTMEGVFYYDFKEGKYNLDVYRKWFQALVRMKEEEILYPGEMILKGDMALKQFAMGNIGMMYVNSAAPGSLEKLASQLQRKCDWAVAMPPAMDGKAQGKGKISILPGGFYCVNKAGSDPEGSVALWKYLYSATHLKDMFEKGYALPIMDNILATNTPALEKLKAFLPCGNDEVYPVPPRIINSWVRFDAYNEALKNSSGIAQALEEETGNLNIMFNSIVDSGTVDSNMYKNPEFDWQHPMKTR